MSGNLGLASRWRRQLFRHVRNWPLALRGELLINWVGAGSPGASQPPAPLVIPLRLSMRLTSALPRHNLLAMELYLSSYELGEHPDRLVRLFRDNRRVGLISNALDFSRDGARLKQSEDKQLSNLRELGLQPEPVDLRQYFGDLQALTARLSPLAGVWVRGGNTFVLAAAYQQSGFDRLLRRTVNSRPDFVYAGFSAGCCALQPSLEGLELVDDPGQVQTAYGPGVVTPRSGLGLLDYAFVPHFDSGHPESDAVGNLVDYYRNRAVVFRALRDGQVIIDRIKAGARGPE